MSAPNPEPGCPFRILHLINGESYAGIERAVTILVRHRRDSDPYIACLMDGEIARHGIAGIGCSLDLIRMHSRLDLSTAIRLARFARQRGIHLIHAHTLRANLVAAVSGRISGIPVLVTLHSPMSRDTEDSMKNRRNSRLQRLLIPRTAAYIAVSAKLEREALEIGIPQSKIRVVRNGIEIVPFSGGNGISFRRSLPALAADALLVGTHSWLRPRKGIDLFLRSIPPIAEAFPRAHFLIAGKAERPDYAMELQQLTQALGIADRVHFLGFRSDIPDFLAALDAFVMPSLFGEGSPFAVLEAMAASRAIVATETEGNGEILQSGISGMLVPPGDPGSMARAIIDLLSSAEYRRKLGAAAYRIVAERFSAERMTAETEAFYLSVLEARISR
jgi:glycosyltransferase involved in cell wall biosynthesis